MSQKTDQAARRERAYDNRTQVALMARRSVIIGELAKMSRGGWFGAKPCDYRPLTEELDRIDARRER